MTGAPNGGGRAARGRLVLALDASTYVGTVAVLRDGVVIAERDTAMRGADEERLMPATVDALADAGVGAGEVATALGAVVCGAGPGSFTSLRIAASIAKGIAAAADAPLLAAPSLALMVAGASPALAPGRYLAVLDAMRGERYAAEVVLGGDVERYEYLGIVAADAVADLARERGAILVEPPGAAPHARGVAALARLLDAVGAADLDAWEPDYGRKAEAQVKWELAHGRALPALAPADGAGDGSDGT
jgi:tRNA threonylcarbamoyladenosine biosynthesis protein TsaB